MPPAVSIRRSLLLNIVALIVLLSGAIFLATFIGARGKMRMLAADLTSQALDRAESRLNHFFEPVIQELLVVRSWGEAGLLDTDDPEPLVRLFAPLIEEHPQISSLIVADERGRELLLLRWPDKWTTRQTRRDKWGDRTRWLEWTDEQPERVESFRQLDYDPRDRPWFQGAVARLRSDQPAAAAPDPTADVHWTQPYTFYTTREPGITASVTFDLGDGLVRVIGFDILLSDISRFTTHLQVGKEGALFVLTDEGRVIGLPRHERFMNEQDLREALLKRPDELGLTLATDAAEAFRDRGPDETGPLRFRSGGRQWWGESRPFTVGPDRTFLATVVVPEADLLGAMTQIRLMIVVIALAALAAAIVQAVHLARRFSRPVEALVERSDRIGRLNLEPGEPIESSFAEVRRLADAQEKMRLSLQNLLKLERDLQLARQIQQGTFPDRMPKLKGFAIDAFSEPAEETGGDTYDVVGFLTAQRGGSVLLSADTADRAVLLMADATGHGVGPALSVTQIRAMLRMAVRMGVPIPRIARHVNEQVHDDLPSGRFITAWLGELNAADGTLVSFSAGQAPLLHYVAARNECAVLAADTPPLGVMDELNIDDRQPLAMNAGDVFAVISDGIFEAMNGRDEQFGSDRTIEVIKQHHRESPAEILTALRAAVDAFAAGRPADDDRTAIIIKRTR